MSIRVTIRKQNKSVGKSVEKWEPLFIKGAAAMESSVEFPFFNFLKELLYDLTIPLRQTEVMFSKRYLHAHVHCSIIHNGQNMEATPTPKSTVK